MKTPHHDVVKPKKAPAHKTAPDNGIPAHTHAEFDQLYAQIEELRAVVNSVLPHGWDWKQ